MTKCNDVHPCVCGTRACTYACKCYGTPINESVNYLVIGIYYVFNNMCTLTKFWEVSRTRGRSQDADLNRPHPETKLTSRKSKQTAHKSCPSHFPRHTSHSLLDPQPPSPPLASHPHSISFDPAPPWISNDTAPPWISTQPRISRCRQGRYAGAPPLHPLLPVTARTHRRGGSARICAVWPPWLSSCPRLAEPRTAIPGQGRASHVKGTSSTRRPGTGGEDQGDAAVKLGGARAGGGRRSADMVVASPSLCCRRPPGPPPRAATAVRRRRPRPPTAGRWSVPLPTATSPQLASPSELPLLYR
jgi:hypothetical protein